MAEESTTPDPVELVVAFFEAANRRDLEARTSRRAAGERLAGERG
jgi:limonene-1,2-epoxide hydrolase